MCAVPARLGLDRRAGQERGVGAPCGAGAKHRATSAPSSAARSRDVRLRRQVGGVGQARQRVGRPPRSSHSPCSEAMWHDAARSRRCKPRGQPHVALGAVTAGVERAAPRSRRSPSRRTRGHGQDVAVGRRARRRREIRSSVMGWLDTGAGAGGRAHSARARRARGVLGDLGHRHLPPALEARHAARSGRPRGRSPPVRRRCACRRAPRAARRSSRRRITRAPRLAALAAKSTGSGSASTTGVERHRAVPRPVVRAKAGGADRARQRADRHVALIVDEHDDDRDPLGDRGGELAGEHQPGAVADQREHAPLGRRELDPDRRRGSHSPCTSSRTRRDTPCPRDRAPATACAGRRASRPRR